MNSKNRLIPLCILPICLMIAGCAPGQLFGPTITKSPTATPMPTATSTETTTPAFTLTPTASTGGIKGTVIGSDNKPGTTVSLNLLDENSNFIAKTTTNDQGQYSFSGVKPGTYFIQYTEVLGVNGGIATIKIGNSESFVVKAGEITQVDIKIR
jgi:hypothetical protein